MKRYLVLTFISTVFFSSLFAPIEEWHPIEEPKPENIDTLSREITEEKQRLEEEKSEAERRLKQAEKEKNEQEIRKVEETLKETDLKLNRVAYDQWTVRIKDYQDELEKTSDPAIQKRMKNEIKDAEEQREAVAERIKSLSQDLKVSYEPIVSGVEKWEEETRKTLKNKLQKEEFEEEEMRTFFQEKFAEIKENYPDYSTQKEVLQKLIGIIDEQVGSFSIINDIQARINQIEKFQKNLPPKLPGNKLVERLKLYEKLPSDQIELLNKEFLNINDIKDNEEAEKALEEMLGAIKRYGLEVDRSFRETIQERINILKTEEKPVDPEIQQAEEQYGIFSQALGSATEFVSRFIPESIKEGISVAIDATSKLLEFTAKDIENGVINAIEQAPNIFKDIFENIGLAGEEARKYAITAQKYAEVMGHAPETLEIILSAADKTNFAIAQIEPVLRALPIEKAQEVARQLLKAQETIEKIKGEKANLEKIAKGVKGAAPFISNVGEIGERIGGFLVKTTQGLTKGKEIIRQAQAEEFNRDLKNAEALIEQERYNIMSQPSMSKFRKAVEPLVNLGRRIGAWFREKVYGTYKSRLEKANQNYTNTRTEYLQTLGFDESEIRTGPSEQEIKNKLNEALKDEVNKKQITVLTRRLAQHTSDLAQVYKEYTDQLNSVHANYEFLVKGWNTAVTQDPTTMSAFTNTLFDMRAQKFAYLDAIQQGIKLLNEEINSVVTPTDPLKDLTDTFAQSLSKMANNEMISTIEAYEKEINEISDNIDLHKKIVENFLKVQQEFPPPG
ncbi:MAG: hypothetical protein WDZ41_04675 [Candidatus Babeliales bacterium]